MEEFVKWKKYIIIGVLAIVLGGFFISGISYYNDFKVTENLIVATDKDLQNVHASIFNNIKSQGLSVEKYGDMVIQAITASMTGRYGASGSKAAFQWIQEQNPTVSPSVFLKLQQVIDIAYNNFETKQRTKIDIIRTYENKIGVFPGNLFASVFGYPKIDLKKLSSVISTEETKKTWDTGNIRTINPFGDTK
jgi:hypothetical protein